jgi:hypothetical protein
MPEKWPQETVSTEWKSAAVTARRGEDNSIAALRTGLNYFLEREIRQESQLEQRRAEAVAQGPQS